MRTKKKGLGIIKEEMMAGDLDSLFHIKKKDGLIITFGNSTEKNMDLIKETLGV